MKIPKIIHIIWFGESYPEKYKQYLLNLIKLNPECTFKFWCDGELASQEMLDDFVKLSKSEEKFQICQIRNYPDLPNFDLIIGELNKSKENGKHKRIHYVRASDIARISILYSLGGVYLDADTEARVSFEDNMFFANTGMGLKAQKFLLNLPAEIPFEYKFTNLYNFSSLEESNLEEKLEYFFTSVLYDFIASVAGHPVLEKTLEITRTDFETYYSSSQRRWEESNNFEILRDGNIKLTGTALKWALNYLYQRGEFVLEKPEDLFVETDRYILSHYDKSWLQEFLEEKDDDHSVEQASLDAFCSEIEQSRSKTYPIVNYGNHPLLSMTDAQIDKIIEMFQPSVPKKRQIFPNDRLMMPFDKFVFSNTSLINPLVSQSDIANFLYEKPIVLTDFFKHPKVTIDVAEVPKIKLPLIELNHEFLVDFSIDDARIFHQESPIKPNPTKQEIYDAYVENGGGLLARLSIFARRNNPDDIIQTLRARVAENNSDDSASRKTLAKLGIQ